MAGSELLYAPDSIIEFCSNRFVGVPIILQFDDTPLLETAHVQAAGYTTKFSIYHKDGTYLAKAVGSQLYPTANGVKAGLHMRHEPGVTACELDGNTLFEIRRTEAAALRTEAELYTPNGSFLKSSQQGLVGTVLRTSGEPFVMGAPEAGKGGLIMRNSIINGPRGRLVLGVNANTLIADSTFNETPIAILVVSDPKYASAHQL